MVSPRGLFLDVNGIIADQGLFGGAKNWLDRIVRDYRTPGSENYIETLQLGITSNKDPNTHEIVLNIEALNMIKDFLPQFDSLFVGCIPAVYVISNPAITNGSHRTAFVNASKKAANQFIQYLHNNNISTQINWYIDWETDINSFAGPFGGGNVDGFKQLFSKYTDELTNISLENGLNAPEFLWSPFYSTNVEPTEVRDRLKGLLDSSPKLGWMHVQDGIGVHSMATSDGHITYQRTPELVISYYNNILAPASESLRNLALNMECFLFPDKSPPYMPPGDPRELEERQSKYRQANIPVGVSFETRYWYGAFYWTPVPRVIGQHFHDAEQTIKNAGLVPIFHGSTTTFQKVIKQEPPASHWDGHQLDWAPKGSNVTVTMEALTLVEVPSVVGSTAHLARQALTPLGLIPVFHGTQGNNKVQSQNPEGGDTVPKHTKVYCEMEQN